LTVHQEEVQLAHNNANSGIRDVVTQKADDIYLYKRKLEFNSDAEPPHVRFVCQEALRVVTKHYKLAFRCSTAIARTWFSFDKDTLFFCPKTFDRPDNRTKDALDLLIQIWNSPWADGDEDIFKVKHLALWMDENER